MRNKNGSTGDIFTEIFSLICSDWFFFFFKFTNFARFNLTTGSMRQYVDTKEVTQVVQLLDDGTSVCAFGRFALPTQIKPSKQLKKKKYHLNRI